VWDEGVFDELQKLHSDLLLREGDFCINSVAHQSPREAGGRAPPRPMPRPTAGTGALDRYVHSVRPFPPQTRRVADWQKNNVNSTRTVLTTLSSLCDATRVTVISRQLLSLPLSLHAQADELLAKGAEDLAASGVELTAAIHRVATPGTEVGGIIGAGEGQPLL
jgi:hypothetical protein